MGAVVPVSDPEWSSAPPPLFSNNVSPLISPPGFDMGAVVPVSEPEWSGAHHGLCLYASRVLQAVWDEQVRVMMLVLCVHGWVCSVV